MEMIGGLFKSATLYKLLRVLVLSEKSFHLRELAREVGCSAIFVKKELESLERIGLVLNSRVGNRSYWEVNRASPFFHEFRALFRKAHSA